MEEYKSFYEQYKKYETDASEAANNTISHPVSNNICVELEDICNVLTNLESFLSGENADDTVISFAETVKNKSNNMKSIYDFFKGDYVFVEQVYRDLKNNLDLLKATDEKLKAAYDLKPDKSNSEYMKEKKDINGNVMKDSYGRIIKEFNKSKYNKDYNIWQESVSSLNDDCKNIANRIDEYLTYLDNINEFSPSEGMSGVSIPSLGTVSISNSEIIDSLEISENPLQLRERGADPCMIYNPDDGFYYYTETNSDSRDVYLYRCKDLNEIGEMVGNEPLVHHTKWMGGGVWAPELHKIGEKWYFYYTDSVSGRNLGDGDINRRLYVKESNTSNLSEGFGDAILMEPPGDGPNGKGYWAIDGSPIEWNGELYFVWSGHIQEDEEYKDSFGTYDQAIYIAHMSSPTTIDGERHLISIPNESFQTGKQKVNEGPQAIVKDGNLCVAYSANRYDTPDYCLGLLTYDGEGDLTDIKK